MVRRTMLAVVMLILALMPAGCIVTDWRWIWEDDDDQQCNYVQSPMQPPGAYHPAPMAVSPPPGARP